MTRTPVARRLRLAAAALLASLLLTPAVTPAGTTGEPPAVAAHDGAAASEPGGFEIDGQPAGFEVDGTST